MEVKKTNIEDYTCHNKETGVYVSAQKVVTSHGTARNSYGTMVDVFRPTCRKKHVYDSAGALGAIEQLMRESFNDGPLLDVLEAMHAKIVADLGIEPDPIFG